MAAISAFLLRFEFTLPAVHRNHLLFALLVWVPVKFVLFRLLGLDRGWWRYISIPDLTCLALANLGASTVGGVLIFAFGPSGFPRSLYILDLLLCFLATAGIRLAVRVALDSTPHSAQGARVFVYGAGTAGVTLLRELRATPRLHYSVCGFIDDNPNKRGHTIQGVKVLGPGPDLPRLIPRHAISEVLIALPSASGTEMAAILEYCHAARVKCRTVPSLAEILEGAALASQVRPVAVEDLLGREPARLDLPQISAKLSGKIVLVTGAAGSIGAELVRQIARFSPAAIVGFEIAESALFHLQQEMARTFPNIPFHPEIGSIKDSRRLTEVFERHRPGIVYHAAAYKHVPLMEDHVFEAVENNIFGTLNVALAAAGNEVDDFVMISSDKAVNPTNVMGATKRMAELVIRSLQNGGIKFVSVRFGNVLGSSGSVVPTFKDQIARGGPVTVTHPEMQRYFMTIPEACQLVLQASAMGRGAEIFVLDMGEPVKILDLARNLILLSGLRPNEDIRIEFTGMRPGEKLYEELNLSDECTLPTPHEKIKIFAGQSLPAPDATLDALRAACENRDLASVVLLLKESLPDYNPSANLLHRALNHSRRPYTPAAGSVR